jgi:hypothetical protein
MKSTFLSRMCKPALAVCLVLMGTAVPVHATPMLYTYTSPTLTEYDSHGGTTFPEEPALGSFVTVQFTYPDELPPDGPTQIDAFTISCGDLTATTPIALTLVWRDLPSTVPTRWTFEAYAFIALPSQYPFFKLGTGRYGNDPTNTTGVGVSYVTESTDHYARLFVDSPDIGLWTVTPVPVPAAVLLLGSGLIPLAWFRRRNRGGK